MRKPILMKAVTRTVGNSSANNRLPSTGAVAATRALCPAPEIGDLIATQPPKVAVYVMNDENLSLNIDGRNFEFLRIG